MKLLKPVILVLGKLIVKPVCELLRSHGVSLATVEFPVRAFFIQRISVGHTADTGNSAIWSRGLPYFLRSLFIVPAGLCPFAFLSRLTIVASTAAQPAARRCCDGWRMRFFITAAAFGRRMLRSRYAWLAARTGLCIVCLRLWFLVRGSIIGGSRVFTKRFGNFSQNVLVFDLPGL